MGSFTVSLSIRSASTRKGHCNELISQAHEAGTATARRDLRFSAAVARLAGDRCGTGGGSSGRRRRRVDIKRQRARMAWTIGVSDMLNLEKRLDALEQAAMPSMPTRWRWLFLNSGQSVEDAQRDHISEHGDDADAGWIVSYLLAAPGQSPAAN